MFIEQAFDRFLGYTYTRVDDTHVEVRLPLKDLYINSMGAVHGGIISSLADVAMSNLIAPDEEGMQQIVTVDLKVSFMRPAMGSELTAKARIINEGRRLVHSECQIFDDQGRQVVQANGIFSRFQKGERR